MASTARAILGISRATDSATLRSSALMMRNTSSVGSVSIDAEAGLSCSVSSFSSTASSGRVPETVAVVRQLHDPGLLQNGAAAFHRQPRSLLGRHEFQTAAEHFHAQILPISDLLERLEKAHQIDHALTGH